MYAIDTNTHTCMVRPDFSMVVLDKRAPYSSVKSKLKPCPYRGALGQCCKLEPCSYKSFDLMCTKDKHDRNNSSADGYVMSGHSKIKIRSAINALYLANIETRQNIRFVTFTFPSLPDHLLNKTQKEIDTELYRLFKKFLNNERNNYGLKKYVWTNERQKLTRDMLHFHCLFQYVNPRIDYYETNLRFLNLLRRFGFNIFANGFFADPFTPFRDLVLKKLDLLDYKWFSLRKADLYYGEPKPRYKKDGKPIIDRFGRQVMAQDSIFVHPVDFEKPINDVVQLGYYLSKYVSKDENKEKVYCRRWASSRGLFAQADQIFNEFDNNTLLEVYQDITAEEKKKGGYKRERQLKPMKFEYEIQGVKYTGYYFPPVFRKWSLDPSMVEYFKNKFNFYLTN